MKRTLFVIVMLLCVALFALPALAEDCDHWAAWCDGKCVDCGTADVNADDIWHKYEKYEYYDETSHWAICTLCGQKDTELWEHNVLCNGTCAECGVTGLPANAENHDYKPVYYDETFHWDTCTICGVKSEEYSNHTVSCMASDTSICEGCGSVALDIWISHVDDMIDANDETHHWTYWPTCGMTGTKEEHYVNCSNPGVCDSCCRSGLDLPVTHIGTRMTGSNETEHWEYCGSCEEEYADTRAAHTVDCITPGVCTVCSASCTNTETHVGSSDGQWYFDDNGHWQLCACGEKLNEGEHGNGTLSGDEYEHWYICTCSAEYGRGWHEQYCDAMGTCIYCGITTLTENADVRHKELPDYTYDAQMHWYPCEGCDTKNIEGGPHAINCLTNTCETCGYNGSDISGYISHQGNISDTWMVDGYSHWRTCDACNGRIDEDEHYDESGSYQKDDTYCWEICTECNNQFSLQEHHVICPDVGECDRCGMAYDGEVEHWIDSAPEYFHDNWQHWYFCDADCGTQLGNSGHDISCKDPTVCLTCGATGLTDQYASHTYGEYERNDTECWVNCTVCGEEIERQKHEGFCSEGYACRYCGTTTGTIKIYHEDDDTYFGDETKHWQKCMHCSEIFFEYEHTVYCSNPGVCADCGRTDCTNEVVHEGPGDDTWYSNDSYHFQICDGCGTELRSAHSDQYIYSSYSDTHHMMRCDVCGYTIGFEDHNAPCNGDGNCIMCGGVSAEVRHSWTNDYDQDNHWPICTNCDSYVIDDAEGHVAYCNAATICYICNASGINASIVHPDKEQFYDDTYHWYTCHTCNTENVEKQEHYTDCGSGMDTCVQCESTNTDIAMIHGYSEQQSDETSHWMFCLSCEENYNVAAHTISCDNPGVCSSCGAACGDDVEVFHYRYADTPYEHNETHHWFVCIMCNEQVFKAEHKFKETEHDESKIVYTCGCGATKEENLHTEHTFKESRRVDAACGVKGEITYTCECGESYTEEIPALEHSYTTSEKPAACGVKGEITYTCECGESYTEEIPALEHSYTTSEKPAACGVAGAKVTTCALCGDESIEVIPALKHKYDITSLRQPTCEKKGIKEVTCKYCADEIVTYIDALGHSYEVTNKTDATCEQDGVIVSTCANCGDEQTEVISAIGHDFGVYVPAGDGTHVSKCDTCGAARVRNCEYQDVITNGITLTVCGVCGHTRYALIPATETAAETTEAPETDVKPDTLFVPTKVEKVTVATAKGDELSGAQLVIYDQTAMLQADSPILAMYTLGLESDGYAVKPKEALRIELALTEEQTAETFEGYKLVIIAMDGTMTEIEYVIEDGKIVFETDQVGILAFLPIEE